MLLKAKIKAKYLDAIFAGKKTMEFRQFGKNDVMTVEDENGRIVDLKIIGMHEASDAMAYDIANANPEIDWNSTEPIMVIKVSPL